MCQAVLSPNLTKKIQWEVSQIADNRFPCVMLLGGLSVNLNHLKTSFTSFCNEMTRKYTTTNPLAAPFMSPNTFLKWLFSWIGSMNIDFRKHIDPWCLYNPKVLACDGTHIGVSIKHLNLATPVTKADSSYGPVAPYHKRYIYIIIQNSKSNLKLHIKL